MTTSENTPKPDHIELRGEWMQNYHGGPWHLAVFHETYTMVTGRVASQYHTTACNGASLYTPYGKPTIKPTKPEPKPLRAFCKRCERIAAKESIRNAALRPPPPPPCGLCGGVNGHAANCQRAVDEAERSDT
jgi:hypothetical protein